MYLVQMWWWVTVTNCLMTENAWSLGSKKCREKNPFQCEQVSSPDLKENSVYGTKTFAAMNSKCKTRCKVSRTNHGRRQEDKGNCNKNAIWHKLDLLCHRIKLLAALIIRCKDERDEILSRISAVPKLCKTQSFPLLKETLSHYLEIVQPLALLQCTVYVKPLCKRTLKGVQKQKLVYMVLLPFEKQREGNIIHKRYLACWCSKICSIISAYLVVFNFLFR